jgi:hypothetical protein
LPEEEDEDYDLIFSDEVIMQNLVNEINEERWRRKGLNSNRRGDGTSRATYFRNEVKNEKLTVRK